MRSGELSLAVEIPPGFSRDVLRGRRAEIGAWIDGAMPVRGETLQGYVQGIHLHWLLGRMAEEGLPTDSHASIEPRFRYNPDIKSLPAIVPAVIPLLLLLIPAMLTALSVVREKEMGSIINLYVTPVTRLEFMLGKQLPYLALAMVNFLCLSLLAVTLFGVPITGSFGALALSMLLFCSISTGMGLLASTVTRSQSAALFLTIVGTLVPAIQYAGLINPIASLEGIGRLVGEVNPTSYIFAISRGVFSKSLELPDLISMLLPLCLAAPLILGAAIFMLKKQEN